MNTTRMIRRVGAALAALALAVAMAAVTAASGPVPTAFAAGAKVTVSVPSGGLNPNGATTVALSGSGFQSVKNGFGGIYVLFGWVSDPNGGSWRPSKGGITGQNYRYVPDDENNPTGYDVFVAFPGSSTEGAANGGKIAADGTWHANITIPGAKFTSYDRAGNPEAVDCTSQQCGIITIGAHGVVNANNETFTPVSFGSSTAAAGQSGAGDGSANGAGAAGEAAATSADGGDAGSGDAADKNAAGKNAGSDATKSSTAAKSATNANAAATGDGVAGTAATPLVVQSASTGPSWGVAGWLLIAAGIIVGLSIIILAAGVGGYLAMKSLLLGVSPAALEKEMARRERRAADMRARQQIKTAKRLRRQRRSIAKAQARAGVDAALTGADGAVAPVVPSADGMGGIAGVGGDAGMSGVAGPVGPDARVASTPAQSAAYANTAAGAAISQAATQVMPPVTVGGGAVGGDAAAGAVATGDGADAGIVGTQTNNAHRAADIRGFFARHAGSGARHGERHGEYSGMKGLAAADGGLA